MHTAPPTGQCIVTVEGQPVHVHDRYHNHQFYQCESEINAFHTAILFLLQRGSQSRGFGGEVGLGASAGRKGGCSWIVLSRAGNIGLIAYLGATYLAPLILSYLIPSGF